MQTFLFSSTLTTIYINVSSNLLLESQWALRRWRFPRAGGAKDTEMEVGTDILELQFSSTVLLRVKVDCPLAYERVHVRHYLCTVPAMRNNFIEWMSSVPSGGASLFSQVTGFLWLNWNLGWPQLHLQVPETKYHTSCHFLSEGFPAISKIEFITLLVYPWFTHFIYYL